MASRTVLFTLYYQGLERAGGLVNLPVKAISVKIFQNKEGNENVRDKLTNRCRHSQDAYKIGSCRPRPIKRTMP